MVGMISCENLDSKPTWSADSEDYISKLKCLNSQKKIYKFLAQLAAIIGEIVEYVLKIMIKRNLQDQLPGILSLIE